MLSVVELEGVMKATYSIASKPERKACAFVLSDGNNTFLCASVEACCRLGRPLGTILVTDILDPYL